MVGVVFVNVYLCDVHRCVCAPMVNITYPYSINLNNTMHKWQSYKIHIIWGLP